MSLFSFAAIKRSKLSQEGQNRVLRVLHHNDHHYTKFIQPDLLAFYSFCPEPSQEVLSLDLTNQRSECSNLCCLLVFDVWTTKISIS